MFGLSCDNIIIMQELSSEIGNIQLHFLYFVQYMFVRITRITKTKFPWFIGLMNYALTFSLKSPLFLQGRFISLLLLMLLFCHTVHKYVGRSDMKPQHIVRIKNSSRFLVWMALVYDIYGSSLRNWTLWPNYLFSDINRMF